MFSVLENEVTCLAWSAARVMARIGESPPDDACAAGLELVPQPAAVLTR
jgi:hypothetical protein